MPFNSFPEWSGYLLAGFVVLAYLSCIVKGGR